MPKTNVTKNKSGDPIQVAMPDSFERNHSIQGEKVFDETDTTMVIKKITIDGKLDGYPSPLVIDVSGETCTITVDFDTP